MSADLVHLAASRPTAKGAGRDMDDAGKPVLRPASLARYRELFKLRYDYPLVLIGPDADNELVRPLSGILDDILREIAPRGIEGERLRKHVLRLEEEVRALASRGARGSLSHLWGLAEHNLLSGADAAARKTLGDSLKRARRALRLDGEVVDCDGATPVKVLTHVWTAVETDKAQKFQAKVKRLVLKLSDIVKADFMKSDEGRAPDNLKRSVGTAFEAVFDFEAMSRILGTAAPSDLLPANRRQRIRSALSVLQSQRLSPPARAHAKEGVRDGPHAFVFDSCTRALSAFRDRLPEMIELFKAIAVAQLEIENRYRESIHDPFFSQFDETDLAPDDLALLPSYLVCLRGDYDATEQVALIEVLSSSLPVKVLVQSDDILEKLSIPAGQFAFGARNSELASMVVGLNSAYVLQSSGAYLYQARDRILRGLTYDGAALFSIFPGSSGNASDLPPFLAAAAATESRAFPTFTYDPAAGEDWASRFCVSDNPQAEVNWPVHSVLYEDDDHQSASEDVAFTFVDFVACDRRFAGRFATVPRSGWHENMIPVSTFLEREREGAGEGIPYLLMVDEDNALQRVLVDGTLIDAARRYRQTWHSLQELGGINNSFARMLLERERKTWEREKERELEEIKGRLIQEAEAPAAPAAAAVAADAAAGETAMEAAVEAPEEPPSDEPYIETPRCTTCNECTDINNRMFAYDENMQAYIADPDAGTYRELVEAAEICQVCIIHPGKPRNANEPDLDELIARAEPFL